MDKIRYIIAGGLAASGAAVIARKDGWYDKTVRAIFGARMECHTQAGR